MLKKVFYSALALIFIAAGAAGFSYLSTPLPLPEYALYYKSQEKFSPLSLLMKEMKPSRQNN